MKVKPSSTKDIVIIALFSAILTSGKLALMGIPNIEIVTLFVMLFTVVFGLRISLSVVIIFCITEFLLFGFNTWVIVYIIYWPLLSLVTYFIDKIKKKKTFLYVLTAAIMTALFGVISSTVDAVISTRVASVNFFVMFSVIYMRGIIFYITHVISNVIFVTIAFPVLKPLLMKIKKQYYNKKLIEKN